MECYRGLQRVHRAVQQVHNLRNEIRSLSGTINSPRWSDSLASLEKKLGKLEGSEITDDVDIVYFSVGGVRAADETFSGVKTKLLYLMMLLQGADAAATRMQIAAVGDQKQVVEGLLERWESIKQGDVAELNNNLVKLGLAPLKAE